MSSVLNLPRACGLLTEQELDITESYDAVTLLGKIASKELTSYTVTTAFCKRAAIAQQVVGRKSIFWKPELSLTIIRHFASQKPCSKML
jgi:hypothetical protein